ncbi:hypothetical protein FRC03_004028 [Tulasnella sp. 419]|nr:hypothetical protein FRC03_004028 [Tulasnella sp. 419]
MTRTRWYQVESSVFLNSVRSSKARMKDLDLVKAAKASTPLYIKECSAKPSVIEIMLTSDIRTIWDNHFGVRTMLSIQQHNNFQGLDQHPPSSSSTSSGIMSLVV